MPPSLPGEFELIERYFAPLAAGMAGAAGLRDDACRYAPPPGRELILTMDTIVAGVHFLPADPPDLIAGKALRVNLSDLAAKGAIPVGYLLSLSLSPEIDEDWVAAFARGLGRDQETFALSLMGGDTVRSPGPATISVAAIGHGRPGAAPVRAGAAPGDAVLVSGRIGDGALGLAAARGALAGIPPSDRDYLLARYRLPEPRLSLGRALVESGLVHAMMDVSDGLLGDLAHIAAASGVGAVLRADRVPLSAAAATLLDAEPGLLPRLLTGGDDYELLLTAAPVSVPTLQRIAEGRDVPLTIIGETTAGAGVSVLDRDGRPLPIAAKGFQHF